METLTGRAVVALLAAFTTGQALYAEPSCTNADLKGVYGMLATGNIIVAPGFPPPLLGPFARAGRVFADGNGNISVANTASYNGTIIPESYSGTYTVNSDCSVDIRPVVGLPIGPGGALIPVPFEFIGALADNGNSAAVVLCGLGPGVPCFPHPLPTGNVIRVLLSRYGVNRAACTDRDLAGDFLVDMSGTVVSGSPLPGPFARDGRLVFDGRGGFNGHAVTVLAGFIIQAEDINGSYSVDSLCNISISFTAGTAHTWVGTLSNAGNGADLIVAESGVVIAGTLEKQKPGEGPE
jgi:hypothetical protein